MLGKSGIPAQWIEPIGSSIQTIAIDPVDARQMPRSLDELTDRVIRLAGSVQYEDPALLRIGGEPTRISSEHFKRLMSNEFVEKQLWSRSPYELAFDLPFGLVTIDYQDGPEITAGVEKVIELSFASSIVTNKSVSLKWLVPESWQIAASSETCINCIRYKKWAVKQTIIPGDFAGACYYLPLEVKLVDRNYCITLNIPFQKKGAVLFNTEETSPICDDWARHVRKIRSV